MSRSSNVYTGAGGGNHRSDVTYDHGNEISIPSVCDNCLAYDAENRLISYAPTNTAYSYDGNGQRVMKQSASDSTVYVYDAFGQLAAEYDTGTAPVSPCGTCYLFSDLLGSVRMITDQSGQVVSRHDYLPFGEELFGAALVRPNPWGPLADTVSQRFTGKERDSESQLDYFGARYYGSALGRFTSPDEFKGGFDNLDGKPAFSPGPIGYADLSDPQTLNMYVYTRNNPLRYVDPDGHAPSDLLYDGETHTLTLTSSDGKVVGSWHAGNNVAIHAPAGEGNGTYTNGPIQDGTYTVRDADQHGATMHIGGSENSAYGPQGIVHIDDAKGATGELMVGAGVHSGRADKGGPSAKTAGCIRTCTDAMKTINQTAKSDPLKTVTVENNQKNVDGWRAQAAKVKQHEKKANDQ